MEEMIKVKNLVKTYKKADKNAVDDISFSVDKGEFFTFLGPNGAGKTTTISILTTTLAKSSGTVEVNGWDIDKGAAKVRKEIGIIFQNPSLDLNLTAEENIRFHAVLFGIYSFYPSYMMMPQGYKDRVMELAEIVGIADEIHKPVKTFSGGMKRKLEIVRSLMHDPKVLFLDEPTTGLDPQSRKNVWQYLNKVREDKGTTIFLTTHYLEEAEKSDNVCIINKGKIVAHGSPKELKKQLIENNLVYVAEDGSEDQLRKELDRMKMKYSESGGRFKIELDHHTPQELIKKIEYKAKEIDIENPTLEDAYIRIIGETKEGE